MVGRERRGGPANAVSGTSVSSAHRKAAAASGAGRRETPFNHSRRSVTQPTSWRTQKGRGRLGHRETASPEHTALRAVNVLRPRKYRRHEECSGVPVGGVPASVASGSRKTSEVSLQERTGASEAQSRVVAGCRAAGEQSSPELTGGDAARERPRAFRRRRRRWVFGVPTWRPVTRQGVGAIA